jgi:hypothetical protein
MENTIQKELDILKEIAHSLGRSQDHCNLTIISLKMKVLQAELDVIKERLSDIHSHAMETTLRDKYNAENHVEII